MYTSFTIENFRLFDHLTVEPLARVNLIAGQNNAGKTALLEALWLHSQPNPRTAQRLGFWRGLPLAESDVLFADLFHGYQTNSNIRICAKGDFTSGLARDPDQQLLPMPTADDIQTSLQISQSRSDFDNEVIFEYTHSVSGSKFESRAWLNEYSDEAPITARRRLQVSGESASMDYGPCVFVPTGRQSVAHDLAIRFGQLEVAGRMEAVYSVLELVEPRLRRLTAIPKSEGVAQIYGDVGIGRMIPVSVMGDGFRRLLNLSLSFSDAGNGVILIDEIENGLHHSVLRRVWEAINQFSHRLNAQVFATTHSYECIQAAFNAFEDAGNLEDFNLMRIQWSRKRERFESVHYTDKEALKYGLEYPMEVR